jgi:predicted DNA-binding ribbon-helix-helix protein
MVGRPLQEWGSAVDHELAVGAVLETRHQVGVIGRSVKFSGHKTSISLEEPFWQALHEIGPARRIVDACRLD